MKASREVSIIAIGLPLVIVIAVVVSLWKAKAESRHKYRVSCDVRGPSKYCEDYYYDNDEYELTCAVKFTHSRCDRANVIGGCRSKGVIQWFYEGSTNSDVSSKTCSSGQWVPADWKEAEEK